MSNDVFLSPGFKRSRISYILNAAFDYCAVLAISGVFLTKLLVYIGLSDAQIGILNSVTSFAFLFQLLSIGIVRFMKNSKLVSVTALTLSHVFFMASFFVPFLAVSRLAKMIIVVVLYVLAYILRSVVSGIWSKWANSFVSPDNRGEYSAVKEIISLISGVLFTLALGYIVDGYIKGNDIEGSFVFLGITILVFNIANFISLILMEKEYVVTSQEKQNRKSLKEVISNTLGNKSFTNLVILSVIYQVATYFTLGFISVYTVKELALSVVTIQVINAVSIIARILVTRPFGKFADKTSFATAINLALLISAVGYAINMFATPSTWWVYAVYAVLNSVAASGLSQNMSNVYYSYVESDYLVQAISINSSIGGIVGFGAALIASEMVDVIQANGNMIFGCHIYAQQVLSGISALLFLAATIFCHKVIRKQKVMKQ